MSNSSDIIASTAGSSERKTTGFRTPFEALGEEGIRELSSAFYDVMDERIESATIRAMHAENTDEIKEKLFEYLTGWMGGPPVYSDKYGSVCLTTAHKPYEIGPAERDQWLDCMDIALERIGASDELKQMLKQPFYKVAEVIRNSD